MRASPDEQTAGGWRGLVVRLTCLLALALTVRLWGAAFGLPYEYHPDEPVHVGQAIGLIHGQTDVLSFANPPLYKYLLVAVFGTTVGPQRIAEVDPGLMYFAARATSAVLGSLTILPAYWLARLLRGERAGLLAAGLASVTYLLVRESHFAVNDALAALCATVALAGCVCVACTGKRVDYLVAGGAVGLAFAAKYQAVLVLAPFLLAHLQRGPTRRHLDLLLGLSAGLLVAIAAFPPLLTETQRVIGDIWVEIVLPSRLGWEGIDPAGGYVYYLKVLGWGVGWPLVVLAVASVAQGVARREWTLLLAASFPLGTYAVIGGSHVYFARYLLPALPALIVLAAVALEDVARRSLIVSALLLVGVVGATLADSLRFDVLLTQTDTRTVAREWIRTHLPPGASVIAETGFGGPPLAELPQKVMVPNGHALADLSLDDYRTQGVEYVVSSSFIAEAPNVDPVRDTQRRAFYAALRDEADLVGDLRPSDGPQSAFVYDRIYGPFDSLAELQRPGPTISVYRLREPAAPAG